MTLTLNESNSLPNKVAIVLATYKPNIDFLREQIKSIQAQTHTNWKCWIVDDHSPKEIQKNIEALILNDKRFDFIPFETNVNSVRNFERGLALIPRDYEYVALSDQDDIWDINKLSILINHFQSLAPDIQLLHTDLRVISEKGQLLAPSCWNLEKRSISSRFGIISSKENLNSMIFSNVVTGCACLFRRSLLDCALPFPSPDPLIKTPYHHDQWLACCALINGKVYSLSQCLVDYRQHDNNVVGAAIVKKNKSLLNEVITKGPNLIEKSQNVMLSKQILVLHLITRFPQIHMDLWKSKLKLFGFLLKEIFKNPALWRTGLQLTLALLFPKKRSHI